MLEKDTKIVTASKHYETNNGIDAIDLMLMSGDAEGFCAGSATKYILRRNHKGSKSEDLIKAFDFVTMLVHMDGGDKQRLIDIIEKRFKRRV